MSQGLRMFASALVGAAITATLFLLLQDRSASPSAPQPDRPAAGAPAAATPAPALAVPVPDLPAIGGDGVVRGRVATAGGDGIAGVVIVATPRVDSGVTWNPDAPPDLNLEEEIDRVVRVTQQRVTGTRRATTDSAGRYALTGLGDVGYSLVAYAPGWTIRAVRGHDYGNAKAGATVDFEASAVVMLRVQVEGAAGGRLSILCQTDRERLERSGAWGVSAENPVLRLAPGTWWVMAAEGDERERVSEPQEIVLAAGDPERTVVLTLEDRPGSPGLRGAIVVTDDLDVRSADVYALRFAGETPPPLDPMGRNPEAVRGRVDMKSGRYSFSEIGPGRYFVWITIGRSRPMGSAVVDIEGRMVERDIEVGVTDPENYVVVRVLGPDGEPADDRSFSFSTSYRGPGISISGGVEAVRRTDGSWLVAPDSRWSDQVSEHPGGTYRIEARHRQLGSLVKVCDPEADRELTFRFQEAATLTVTVRGLTEHDFGGPATLNLYEHMEPSGMSSGTKSARAGGDVFVLDQVQPGQWFLVLSTGDIGGWIMIDRMPVKVGEGENPIEWVLPTLYEVSLEPALKEKPVRFGLTRIDPAGNWMHQFARSEEGGDAVFRFVPAGRYELTGSYEGESRRIQIDVPGQTRVFLE